jgi:hypothetical protein
MKSQLLKKSKIKQKEEEKRLPKGFVVVASFNKQFLHSAVFCAETLKEYYSNCHVTLFTIDEWIEPYLFHIFDNVVGGAPNNKRAKLWALSKTPYDLTVYLDADVEIMHPDIQYIFDQMESDTDILMTKIRGYNGKISVFPGGELTDHCGLFMYRSTPKVIEFMKQWWLLYQKQESREWKWDTKLYPEELRAWDQWSYWWLQNKTEYAIKRKYFTDDARWNFVNGYLSSETDKPIVIYHHTVR